MGRLSGRRAIVTGAASGIGRATAQLFASEGARVLAVDRPGADLSFDDPAILGLAQDISLDEAPETIVGKAAETFSGLDILYNNAGISHGAPVADTTDEAFDRLVSVNLRAAFRLSRQATPHLVESGRGRLIFTASIMARHTDNGLVAYSASKAGVVGMMRTFALELGRHAVTANAILPGAIATGMTAASFQREEVAGVWAKKAALKRLGQPIDIARAALFLASDDGGFVTGQALGVDGGLMLRV
ncbi:MAG TPA: SDR family NAD(P)-dependent oxidoreductase [Caulobacter sp.]|nr:SDR family NAD(P)-dependent oxidoreductase [Caulobacter sp.]